MSQKLVSTQDLVVWVNKKRLPMAQVEALSGMTRQGIFKRLKAEGRFIPRRAKDGAPGVYVRVDCAWCGLPVKRRKKLLMQLDTLRSFCNQVCYAAALENPSYVEWRQGSRLAQTVVGQHFRLRPGYVVHHKDGDQRNNDRSNLMVFASIADHTTHHRGRKIKPLWDGAV